MLSYIIRDNHRKISKELDNWLRDNHHIFITQIGDNELQRIKQTVEEDLEQITNIEPTLILQILPSKQDSSKFNFKTSYVKTNKLLDFEEEKIGDKHNIIKYLENCLYHKNIFNTKDYQRLKLEIYTYYDLLKNPQLEIEKLWKWKILGYDSITVPGTIRIPEAIIILYQVLFRSYERLYYIENIKEQWQKNGRI